MAKHRSDDDHAVPHALCNSIYIQQKTLVLGAPTSVSDPLPKTTLEHIPTVSKNIVYLAFDQPSGQHIAHHTKG